MPIEKLARNFCKILQSDLADVYRPLNLVVPNIRDPIPDESLNKFFFEELVGGLSASTRKKIKAALGWEDPAKIDHGVVGALLLLRSIQGISGDRPNEAKALLQNEYKAYLVAARAIMLHNLYEQDDPVEIDSSIDPLCFLLICCDEMQEWGREVNIKDRKFLDPRYRKTELVRIASWKYRTRN